MRVVGYRSLLPNYIEDSTGASCAFQSLREALEFLTEPYEIPSEGEQIIFRMAWDVDEFAAVILRLLPKELALELHETTRCQVSFEADYGTVVYKLWYAREKGFAVKNLGLRFESMIFHLKQFFPEGTDEPEDTDYCINLEAYGRYLLQTFKKMGFQPQTLYSPVSALKPVLAKMNLPTFKDMPQEASLMAIECAGRPWHEAIQLGRFEQVWDYDLSSAYPTILSKCLDIRLGRWVQSPNYQMGAMYGYAKCKVTIFDKVKWHPIVMFREDDVNVAPTGTWPDCLSKRKIDLIKRWGIGETSIQNSWWWIPETSSRPLFKLVNRLQSLRHSEKEADVWDYEAILSKLSKKLPAISLVEKLMSMPMNRLMSHLAKAMLVGVFGYTGQEKKDTLGEFYNPVYFSEATEQTACLVADHIYKNKVAPIAISTDGFLSPVELPLTEGWKLNYSGEAIVLSTNAVYYAGKKPAGLYIDELKSLIQKNPTRSYWQTTKPRLLTLGNAVEWSAIDRIGEEVDIRTSVDLNIAHDRYFPKLPRSGRDILSKKYMSRPYTIEEV